MVWPFFVCYVPFISYQLAKIRKEETKKEQSKVKSFVMFLAITPLLLVYLFLVDVVFLLLSAVVTPVLSLISVLTCQTWMLIKLEECIDFIYVKLFGMQMMDVIGFRRLRTSC